MCRDRATALRSTLPLGVSGKASRRTKAEGIIGSGAYCLSQRRSSVAVAVACSGRRDRRPVEHFLVRRAVRRRRQPATWGWALRASSTSPSLDAVSADLDLVVDASQAFEGAVGPPSCEVAGAVEAVSWFSKRGRGGSCSVR